MSIVEIYKPEFGTFQGLPVVTWKEKGGYIRTDVNMYVQYMSWLHAWTDSSRDRHGPAPAFWESHGPQICRAITYCNAAALIFDYVTDSKVVYKWMTRSPEDRPTQYKENYYSLCSVHAAIGKSGEGRVTVTMPTDEDFTFNFFASTMKGWLKPAKPMETATP